MPISMNSPSASIVATPAGADCSSSASCSTRSLRHPLDIPLHALALKAQTTTYSGQCTQAATPLSKFYSADISARAMEARKVTEYLSATLDPTDIEGSLYIALSKFPPMGQLVNETMHIARPVDSLGTLLFSNVDETVRNRAVTALLALGSTARKSVDEPGLLPCRIHAF